MELAVCGPTGVVGDTGFVVFGVMVPPPPLEGLFGVGSGFGVGVGSGVGVGVGPGEGVLCFLACLFVGLLLPGIISPPQWYL